MSKAILNLIYEYVKHHPKKTATEISQATGIKSLSVQRYLNSSRLKYKIMMFERVKVTRKLRHEDGKIRGSYCFLYSIHHNYEPDSPVVLDVPAPNKFVRDQITAALFSHVA
jgi:hypothetical protein